MRYPSGIAALSGSEVGGPEKNAYAANGAAAWYITLACPQIYDAQTPSPSKQGGKQI